VAIRSTELDSVLAELDPSLVGARLQEVRVPSQERLVLSLRAPGQNFHLLFVVQSVHARLHRVDAPPRNPLRPPATQGLLRGLLRGNCRFLRREGADRVVRMGLGQHDLLVELTGRHGNLFILDPQGLIVASLLANRSHRRDLRPGEPWVPPASVAPPPRSGRFLPPDVNGQMAAYYLEREATDGLELLRQSALRRLRALRRKAQRKERRQLEEADRGEEAASLRREADLLNAHFSRLRRGMASVELPDLFEPGEPPRVVTLDPRRPLRDEMDLRYKKARRLERGMKRAAEEWEKTTAALERLQGAVQELEGCSTEGEIDEAVTRWPPRWRPQQRRGRRRKDAVRAPFHTYLTPAGKRILVGRSGEDNDTLTFRQARGRDVWLHVVGRPGAHVVVPLDGHEAPDADTLDAAAQLTLAHSGVAEGHAEEVAWTRVKYVRKVKGGAPGRVTYSQERVMRVRRDRGRLEGVERQ